MHARFRSILSACAILIAGHMATSGPAGAKTTIQCKTVVVGTSTSYCSKVENFAKKSAYNDWDQKVKAKYGAEWMGSGDAANAKLTCWLVTYGSSYCYKCVFWGKPCAQVKLPSSSQAQPDPPSARTTIKLDDLPEPSDTETRTPSPGGRTDETDQPAAATQIPSTGRTPAPSSGSTVPR